MIGSFAIVHRGMDAMWDVFRRFVAVGGQGVLTFLILVMAVARIRGVSYVTTVLDQISLATLFPLLLSEYAFFWFSEYWTNRLVSEALLELLKRPADRNAAKCWRSSSTPHEVKTGKGRIAIHVGARFVVVENWEKNAEFRLYGRADLFEEFDQPSPEPAQDLRTRIRLYFRLATAAILVPLGGAGLERVGAAPVRPARGPGATASRRAAKQGCRQCRRSPMRRWSAAARDGSLRTGSGSAAGRSCALAT